MTDTMEPSQNNPEIVAGEMRQEKVVYVDRLQFCKLLISRRKLIRSDDQLASILGLTDLETGVRYLIRENEL